MQAEPHVTLEMLLSKLRSLDLCDRCDALGDIFLDRDLGSSVPLKDAAKLLRDAGVPSITAIAIRETLLEVLPPHDPAFGLDPAVRRGAKTTCYWLL
jgi:hypothetical protein